jgi:hypothetical protein
VGEEERIIRKRRKGGRKNLNKEEEGMLCWPFCDDERSI